MDARLLIVDDEEAVTSMLKVVFETGGYEVTTAASAAEASSLLSAQDFDLVLTDMKMETDTAGLDVVQAARGRPYHPAIVILTAFPMLAREWRAAGVDAALTKPSNMTALLNTVRRLLQERRQRSTRLP